MAAPRSSLLMKLGKAGIVGLAVYGTAQLGVWTCVGERETQPDYLKAKELVASLREVKQQRIPSLADLMMKWNSGVKTVFGFVADVPENTVYYGRKATDSGIKAVKELTKS